MSGSQAQSWAIHSKNTRVKWARENGERRGPKRVKRLKSRRGGQLWFKDFWMQNAEGAGEKELEGMIPATLSRGNRE